MQWTNISKKQVYLADYSEDFNNPHKFYTIGNILFKFEALDDNGKIIEVSGQHAIAIVGSDKDFVYLIDPYDSSRKLHISWAKFRLMYAKLNNACVCKLPSS